MTSVGLRGDGGGPLCDGACEEPTNVIDVGDGNGLGEGGLGEEVLKGTLGGSVLELLGEAEVMFGSVLSERIAPSAMTWSVTMKTSLHVWFCSATSIGAWPG
mmetsp:Transcript_16870/g.34952  ORF Transcript_16870/g.34952 Transcript_16870/m.34952 type:complete len:102 (-) Transcript_16870:731-1036(-)